MALFSWIGVLFDATFTRPIFNAFGLSIVVLTLIIKLVLFPLTLKQLRSAKVNQALQPQLQEIRRKYAKDPQGLNMAMQALYKEYGINPLAGCLPTLIQLPVLFGMYAAFNNVLRSAPKDLVSNINSNLYPFIAHFTSKTLDVNLNWFTWLNSHWSISLATPDPTHILPIIAAVATFVQLRMSLPKTAPAAKSAQPDPTTSTMKTMQYIMPFFTLYIGWSFPAGLALYHRALAAG